MKHHVISSLVFLALGVAQSLVHASDLTGQTADYLLDKNPARTSSMIKSGSFNTTVGQLLQSSTGPAYEVLVKYKFNIALFGIQQGEQKKAVEEAYFTPEFLEELRVTGHYEGELFKAKHLGYKDAKNLDGKFYPHCDVIELYDLKDVKDNTWINQLLVAATGNHRGKMENLRIIAHIFPGVPVIGAVKLDLSGDYQGTKVKAGGDYQAK